MVITTIIGIIIGLVLGLTGSGGSVFAVPLLILLVPLPVNEAVGIALWAVSMSALYGAVNHWRYKSILWLPVALIVTTGVIAAPIGRWAGNQVPDNLLLTGFSVLAVIIALRMWFMAVKQPDRVKVLRSGTVSPEEFTDPVCRMSPTGQFEWRFRCVSSLLMGGIVVGILTGLFGVGGGFLIVPLLLFLNQVSMQQAVGTSLVIIAAVSGAGFVSYAATAQAWNWALLVPIALGGVIGMICGHFLAKKIAGPTLQKVFSVSLLLIVIVTLVNRL